MKKTAVLSAVALAIGLGSATSGFPYWCYHL